MRARYILTRLRGYKVRSPASNNCTSSSYCTYNMALVHRSEEVHLLGAILQQQHHQAPGLILQHPASPFSALLELDVFHELNADFEHGVQHCEWMTAS